MRGWGEINAKVGELASASLESIAEMMLDLEEERDVLAEKVEALQDQIAELEA